MKPHILTAALSLFLLACLPCSSLGGGLTPGSLSCEYLPNPAGVESTQPRLGWMLEGAARAQRQTGYRIVVASSQARLDQDQGDLWDTGKTASDQTAQITYGGKGLTSGQVCFWKVRVWDKDAKPSAWSAPAKWSMGLLEPEDWKAEWVSYRDTTPLHTRRDQLFLPAARHFRRDFEMKKPVKRATLYASALGIADWHINGQAVSEGFFEPGWADYHHRAYYRTYDVSQLLNRGANRIGVVLADGWYSGYVGYGLLVGQGPNRVGRYFYGKTPAVIGQLEIEYADGSTGRVGTDGSWEVSGDGPIREADLIMGEAYDARREERNWSRPGFVSAWTWEKAVPAASNGTTRAVFSDNQGDRQVDLGFKAPARLQAYLAPPIRITQELPARKVTSPGNGTYIFDLGQNFAGVIRLRVKGEAGTRLQIRYGEMLHPDGRLMTENLRRARATDFYTLRGDPVGETWIPRFTYHGFQYVEITGLAAWPSAGDVVGLVLHNDTPMTGSFECSDAVLTRFGTNAQWTQRANFIEVPTDCPQRDERLGWMGDAQAYIRTASYNADVAAFFTKWLDDVEEAQRTSGAYPDYCPYPMGHGHPFASAGTAWTDAGIICPWTIWQVYGDRRILERHWGSMTRFMDWRASIMHPEGIGVEVGNPWGDWLNVDEPTPVDYVDTCYHALSCRLMAEMASALDKPLEAARYQARFKRIQAGFNKAFLKPDYSLSVGSQTAYVLALQSGLLSGERAGVAAGMLAGRIATAGYRMTTGFLGTRALLPALSAHGHHDLAVRLFQSREFPSWGYEVVNGATTVWERWDSYTKEHGFEGRSGKQNASMNSFSHYAFGAVMEWAYRDLAGIDTDGPGFQKILIRPGPPAPNTYLTTPPVDWVRAEYRSIRGKIVSAWKRDGERFELDITIPPNTTATVHLPARETGTIIENGSPLDSVREVKLLSHQNGRALLAVPSGTYRFESKL